MELASLISALRRPEAYPHAPPTPVDVLQTHISVLFFAGDRVYKVKKPVTLEFLDYGTLDLRHASCTAEVRLNRRLAGDVYRGVVPIVQRPDGTIRVGPEHDGEIIDYAVEMQRLPATRMLSSRLDRGDIDNEQLDRIARTLASFHADCRTGPGVDAFGQPEELIRQSANGIDELAPFVGQTLSPMLRDQLGEDARRWLEAHTDLLRRRVHDGHVREGHGDVHADNICLLDDRVVIYDCIEFNDRFRCRDVACEIAFLAMDLDLRGGRGFAGFLVRRYAELTNDAELAMLQRFYKPHLAIVRGKVTSIRAVDPAVDADARDAAIEEAMRYFHLAIGYTLPPSLVLMCGLPGTGKSHAARRLARPLGATVLRSDVIRKTLAGLSPSDRGADIYSDADTDRTYATLADRTREHLEAGHAVVVDATFSTRPQRAAFMALATDMDVPVVVVELQCDEDEVRRRLRARRHDKTDPSDADERIFEQARMRFESPDEVPPDRRVILDSVGFDERSVAAVLESLVAAVRA